MEGLDLDYIVDEDDLGLFTDDGQQPEQAQETPPDEGGGGQEKHNTAEEEEVDVDALFQTPESVGGGDKNNKETKEDAPSDGDGASPNNDFFSSIAQTFAEEGIFPDLDEDTIKGIKTAEDFRKAIDAQLKAGLDEQQKRVNDALNAGIEPDEIRQYEGIIAQLNGFKEEDITAEGDQGEDLRKRLIFQDFLNRGFDRTRAEREVNKALQNGTDIEDAKEALKSNREFFQTKYQELIDNAKKEQEQEEQERQQRATKLKETILDPKTKFFDELELDANTRQRVFDSISKPIYKDSKTGEVLTAVQKYEAEHREDFLVKVGLLYTLTDGFKSLDGLVKGKVNKEMRKGFNALESKINNTARDNDGNLRYSSGVSDSEDYLGKGMRLDI